MSMLNKKDSHVAFSHGDVLSKKAQFKKLEERGNLPGLGEGNSEERRPFANFVYGLIIFGLVYAAVVLYQNSVVKDRDSSSTESSWNPMDSFVKNPSRSAGQVPAPKIDQIALNLIRSEDWDVQKIHFLKRTLLSLDEQQKAEMIKQPWLPEFEHALDTQLNQPSIKDVFTNDKVILRQNALVDIQTLLKTAKKSGGKTTTKPNKSDDKPEHRPEHRPIVTANAKELVKPQKTAEPEKKGPGLANMKVVDNRNFSVDTKTGTIVKKIETKTKKIPSQAKQIEKKSENKSENKPEKKTRKKIESVAKNKSTNKTENNIERVARKKTEQKTAYIPPISEFEPKPRAAVKPKQTTPVKPTFVAKAKAGVPTSELKNKKTLFSTIEEPKEEKKKYRFVNGLAKFSKKPKNKQNVPTIAELNNLTVQLIHAYETGDLERFGSLFDDDPESEHYEQLERVKSEYEDLVYQTSDRQMFIRDMKWSFEGDEAIGKGTLTLVTLFSSQAQVLNRKKQLEMIARKDKNKILITRFE